MKKLLGLAALIMTFTTGAALGADGFAGTYKGKDVVVTIAGDGPQFAGTIEAGGQKYPLTAVRGESGGGLAGVFRASGAEFKFTATLSGKLLTFSTDGTTYLLERQSAPPPAGQPGAGSVKFTKLSVHDPGINDIEAVSFLIPAGWKVEGGVQWFPDYTILANLLMRVTDPETGATIEFLPLQNFTWIREPVYPMANGTNYMGNIVWPPIQNPLEIVQTFYVPTVLRHLQGARVGGTEELAKVAEELVRQSNGQSQARATRTRFEFSGPGGQPWEEDVYLTAIYTPWQLGTSWSVITAYSFRAPKGRLDALTPVMDTSIRTFRIAPDWWSGYMYVQKLFNNRMNQDIKNAAAISATITRNNEEIRKMYADAYRERQASEDRIAESRSEYIRGVDTYKNPYEDRPVQLPAGYNDVWTNPRGEYLLSNQAGFDPNVGDTTEWRRMERRDGR